MIVDITKKKRKMNTLKLSINVFVLINSVLLWKMFFHQIIYLFIYFLFLPILGLYLYSLFCSIFKQNEKRKNAILINIATPIVAAILVFSDIPIFFNFIKLYPARVGVVAWAETFDEYENDFPFKFLCPEGIRINCFDDEKRVYFKIREEFLMSNDFPDNVDVTAGNSGFEYSSTGFTESEMLYAKKSIYLTPRWRYVTYDRICM